MLLRPDCRFCGGVLRVGVGACCHASLDKCRTAPREASRRFQLPTDVLAYLEVVRHEWRTRLHCEFEEAIRKVLEVLSGSGIIFADGLIRAKQSLGYWVA